MLQPGAAALLLMRCSHPDCRLHWKPIHPPRAAHCTLQTATANNAKRLTSGFCGREEALKGHPPVRQWQKGDSEAGAGLCGVPK